MCATGLNQPTVLPEGEAVYMQMRNILSHVMDEYMDMYPDEKGFYEWLAKEGYLEKR